MALPDLSRLPLLPLAQARELAARLRALGTNRAGIAPFARRGEHLPDNMRRPVRSFHLRRENTALAFALRLFVFMDPVSQSEALAALESEALFAALLDVGLIVPRASGFVCPLFLNVVEDQYVFCDDLSNRGEAVMGAGPTTADLIQAAWPVNPLGSVLDLGCGAGSAALLLARRADRVVGSDINPRAILLAQFNACLAGTTNVEFVAGDLFAPVADTRFDLVVSQPPFVSKLDSEDEVTFLHGGARGDELLLRILAELPPRLASNGRAVLLVDWPRYDDVPAAKRIRDALGPGSYDLLLLASAPKNLDEYAAFYAAGVHPDLGDGYTEAVHAHLGHLARLGVRELRAALIVIRVTPRTPWTHQVQLHSLAESKPTGAQIERLIQAQDLLAGETSALMAARLVVPEGSRFSEDGPGQTRVELSPSRLIGTVLCSQSAAELLSHVNQSQCVCDAIDTLTARLRLDGAAGRELVLEGVRSALRQGLLEVVLSPQG